MPKTCECPRCVRFRERDDNKPTLSHASFKALEKANTPHSESRRVRIKAGRGKGKSAAQAAAELKAKEEVVTNG